MSAAEEFLEYHLEVLDDLVEILLEPGLDRPVHLADYPEELVPGLQDILPLAGEEFISLGYLLVLGYRADVDLAKGLSQVQYLDMGLTESYMAPGWYTKTGLNTYIENNLDNKAADAASWKSIDIKMDNFGKDMGKTFDFFSKKILSQWNEPEFESIWVSKVKTHTNPVDSGLGKAVYEGSLGQLLSLHFNLYIQIVYLLFAVGIYMMFINKKTNICTILLPLVALGGFGYHLLFEGKSQYVLTYIPLLLPVAAYSLNTILEANYSKVKEFAAKLNAKVPKKEKTKK